MSLTKEAVQDKMKDLNVVLLNILPAVEFQKIHIKGSDSLAFGNNVRSFALAVEKKYGKDKFFITYGGGRESTAGLNAAKVLQENGLKAEVYTGGIQDWLAADLPTEGTQPKDNSYRY